MKVVSRLLILLLLAALIGIPPILTGFTDLALARAAQNESEVSFYYESAARLLFWRRELYEQAGQFARNDPQRAITLFLKARDSGELSPNGGVKLGDAYLASGNTDQAVAEWRDLLATNHEIPAVALRLSQIYHSRHQFSYETAVLKRWLAEDNTNPEASQKLGIILAAADSLQALSLLEVASSGSETTSIQLVDLISSIKDPSRDAAYRLARNGQALARLSEWPLAELAFERAVSVNPVYAEAWAWLGLARQQTGSSTAQAAFDQAIRLNPQSAPIRAMLGSFLQQNGKYAEARDQFTMATRLEPTNAAWWAGLGGVEAHIDLASALKDYIQAVNLSPQEPAYWYELATFCVEQNSYVEDYGLSAALRAYALEPDNPSYMDMLGRVQMAVGQTSAAEVMFNKALDTQAAASQGHVYHFHLGLLYLQTGQTSRAKSEFEQVVKLDPSGTYGAQAMNLIARYFP